MLKQKHPRDPNQLAKSVIDLATGQKQPTLGFVDPHASAMGKKGGAARAASMTPERRREIAKMAAAKRWRKD